MATNNAVQGEPSKSTLPPFGLFTALAIGMAAINLTYSGLLPLSTIIGAHPTSQLPILIGAGAVFGVLLVYTYAVIGSAAPHGGADYIFTSRVLGGKLGFIASWVFVIYTSMLTGAFVLFLVRELIPYSIRQVAIIGNVSGLITTADYLHSQQGAALLGTILTLVFFLLALLPPKVTGLTIRIGFFLSLLAWAIILFQLSVPLTHFQPAWDQFLGANSYENQLNLARSANLPMLASLDPISLHSVVIGMWLFLGAVTPSILAGHIKRPQRTLVSAGLLGILITGAIIAVGVLLAQRLISPQWLSAQSFLYLNGQSDSAMPWISFYASLLRPNLLFASLVSILLIYSMINLVQVMFFLSSRIMVAWANDQIIPSLFAYEHPLLKTPVINLFVVGVLVQFGLIDAALGGNLSGRFIYIFYAGVALVLPLVAGVVFPFAKKEWYRKAGGLVGARIGPLPLISVAAFLALVGIVIALFGVWSSGMFMGVRIQAVISLIIVAAVGWGIFALRERYLKQSGNKLAEIFARLPDKPE